MKTCSKCKTEKPLTQFSKRVEGRDGHRAQCKECRAKIARAWLDANPAKHNAASAKWRKKNPELALAAVKKWNKEHPKQAATNWANYTKHHRAETNAKRSARRAKQRRATPAWANKFFIEEAYDLAQRRTKAAVFKWEVDHIVPMKHPLVQGLRVEFNLQVIPQRTNRIKHNRYWPDMPQEAS